MVSPTAGDPCCGPTGRTPSPLDKPAGFEGVRDVHVSVSLMEDFMRCAVADLEPRPFVSFWLHLGEGRFCIRTSPSLPTSKPWSAV